VKKEDDMKGRFFFVLGLIRNARTSCNVQGLVATLQGPQKVEVELGRSHGRGACLRSEKRSIRIVDTSNLRSDRIGGYFKED